MRVVTARYFKHEEIKSLFRHISGHCQNYAYLLKYETFLLKVSAPKSESCIQFSATREE